MATATATFAMKTWDEKPWGEVDGARKITHTFTTNTYTGEIEGESSAHYITTYVSDEEADYVGYEQIVGKIGGREGSIVLECAGQWRDNVASTVWKVVDGAGTGDLAGLTGNGGYVAKHGDTAYAVTLEYTIPGGA